MIYHLKRYRQSTQTQVSARRKNRQLKISLLIHLFALIAMNAEAREVRLLQLNIETPKLYTSKITNEQKQTLGQKLKEGWVSIFEGIKLISPQELLETLPEDFDPTSCGSKCPLIIGRAALADLVIYGELSGQAQKWQLEITMVDVFKDKDILHTKVTGSSLNSLSASLFTSLREKKELWHKRLSKIAERPMKIYRAEQAVQATSNRWVELGIEWIPIRGASYEMGNPKSHPSERPVHAVEVSSFQMMKTEVTASQYWACVQAGVCTPTPESKGCVSLGLNAREAVNCVTWSQARTFAEWIGARLPSEMEWELAARGTEGRRFPWGDQPASCEHLSYASQDGLEGCGEPSAQAPCSYPRGLSPQGLCDLAGNLWEWVEDDWHRDYRSAPTKGPWCEPSKDLKRSCSPTKRRYKTYRGGSWYHPASRAQSSSRAGALHSVVSVGVGFRCAL